jgi:hypothetical protein
MSARWTGAHAVMASSPPLHGRLLAALLGCAMMCAAPSHAQTLTPVRGVVADEDGRVLAGSVQAIGTRWRTQAAADGSFVIELPPGSWRIRAHHIGFQPDTVEVRVPRDPDVAVPLEFRLRIAPVVLSGLTVEGARPSGMTQTVTTETVRQVPPIGEPDVFRAVVLLPGVSQPNDLKGRIHLAGGSSDETGVTLDGHPLQDPFHLLGVSGAFNVAALESADVLIHHLPASHGGRLSGVVDMRTRVAAETRREAVASLISAGGTWSSPEGTGGVDVLASARVTYLDKVVQFLLPSGSALGEDIPLVGYRDALIRLGRDWNGWRTEALGFHTRDNLRGAATGPGYPPPLEWGESLAGLTVARRSGAWDFSARASYNRAAVQTDQPDPEGPFVHNRRGWTSTAAVLSRRFRRAEAEAGLALDARTYTDRWRSPGLARQIFSPRTPAEYAGSRSQTEFAAFGEVRADVHDRSSVSAGARLTQVGGRSYLAPRLLVSYQPSERLRVEAALNRRFQFDAELEEPIEGNVSPPRFLLAVPRRADVAALSADWRWIAGTGREGSLRGTVFTKRYDDRPVVREAGVPAQGPFPDFMRIQGASHGATVAARWSQGDAWIVQGSYTFQRARERVDGRWYPTAWDAPHDGSVFTSVRVLGSWHLNAVYRGHSGRATTPVAARVFVSYEEFENYLRTRYLRGERNSVRVPAYHRLDVGARRSWQARGAEWTVFAQVLNVLWQDNPIDYDWFQFFASASDPSITRYSRRGLPLLPSVGMEVRW